MSLTDDLRHQMQDLTAYDTPSPDLIDRVHAGVRRRRRRTRMAGAVLALGAVVGAGVSTVALRQGSDGDRATLAQTSAPLGPSDAELRAARWYGLTYQPEGEPARTIWRSRDGRVIAPREGGGYEKGMGTAERQFGIFSFDEVLALPADPALLRARILGTRASGSYLDTAGDDDYVAAFAANTLEIAPATQPVRAALVELLSGLNGTQVTARPGRLELTRPVQVGMPNGSLTGLVIDIASSRVIAESAVTGTEPTPSQTYIAWLTQLTPDARPFAD